MAAVVQRDTTAVAAFLASVGLSEHATACCDAFVAAQYPSSQWVPELEQMVLDRTLRDFIRSVQVHAAVDSVRLLEGKPGEIEACFASAGPLGITFEAKSAKDTSIYVRAIKPTGLAMKPAFAALSTGLQLTSVQGTRCADMSYTETIELIKRAARPLRLTFFGEDIDGKRMVRAVFRSADRLGIQFASAPPLSPRRNPIIKSIRPDGLAARPENSALVPGLVLESVQGKSVGDRGFKDVVAQIRDGPRPLELVFSGSLSNASSRQQPNLALAMPGDSANGKFVTATFMQPGSLGLKFKPHKASGTNMQAEVRVAGINPGTQAEAHPQLTPEMTLVTVGELSVVGMPYKKVIDTVRAAGRPLTCVFAGEEVEEPKQTVQYTITTHTGDVSWAGTDANVAVKLFGSSGESERCELSKEGRDNFERNRTDTFTVECADVGQIHKLRIGHDNSGVSSGWFLDSVEVSREGFRTEVFACSQWFATDEGDGKIERELVPVAPSKAHRTQVNSTLEKISVDQHKREHADCSSGVPSPIVKPSGEVLQVVHTDEGQTFHKDEVPACTDGKALPSNAIVSVESQVARKYRVLKLAAVRDGMGPDAARIGRVNIGDLVTVFELQEGPEGLTKARTEKGWVAMATFSGSCVLEPIGDPPALSEPPRSADLLPTAELEAEPKMGVDLGGDLDAVVKDDGVDIGAEHPKQNVAPAAVQPIGEGGDENEGEGEEPKQTVQYTITTHTGDVSWAGTDANVAVKLFGSSGESERCELSKEGRDNFERNRTDTFTVECADVGQIHKLRIGHDNSGVSSGWFLDSVEVSREGFRTEVFACSQWFATDEGDSKIERDLVLAPEAKARQQLATWLSAKGVGKYVEQVSVSLQHVGYPHDVWTETLDNMSGEELQVFMDSIEEVRKDIGHYRIIGESAIAREGVALTTSVTCTLKKDTVVMVEAVVTIDDVDRKVKRGQTPAGWISLKPHIVSRVAASDTELQEAVPAPIVDEAEIAPGISASETQDVVATHGDERTRLRKLEAELASARDLLKTNFAAAKHPASPTSSIASSAESYQNQVLQRQLQDTAHKLAEAETQRRDAERRAALSSQALATLPGVLATHMQGHLSPDASVEVVGRVVADVIPLDDPIRRTFARFDRNGDGVLDADEQKIMLETIGHAQHIDDVADDNLDYQGFRALLARLHVSSSSPRSSSSMNASDGKIERELVPVAPSEAKASQHNDSTSLGRSSQRSAPAAAQRSARLTTGASSPPQAGLVGLGATPAAHDTAKSALAATSASAPGSKNADFAQNGRSNAIAQHPGPEEEVQEPKPEAKASQHNDTTSLGPFSQMSAPAALPRSARPSTLSAPPAGLAGLGATPAAHETAPGSENAFHIGIDEPAGNQTSSPSPHSSRLALCRTSSPKSDRSSSPSRAKCCSVRSGGSRDSPLTQTEQLASPTSSENSVRAALWKRNREKEQARRRRDSDCSSVSSVMTAVELGSTVLHGTEEISSTGHLHVVRTSALTTVSARTPKSTLSPASRRRARVPGGKHVESLKHDPPAAAPAVTFASSGSQALLQFAQVQANPRLDAYMNVLGRVALLNTLTDADRLSLAKMLNTIEFQSGQHIITAGHEADGMFLVESGTAAAVNNTGTILKSYAVGDFFGELALMDATARRKVTVVSTSFTTTLLKLPSQAYQEILDANDGVRLKIAQRHAEYVGIDEPAQKPVLASSTPPPLPSSSSRQRDSTRHELEIATINVCAAADGVDNQPDTALLTIYATAASFGLRSHGAQKAEVLWARAVLAQPGMADSPLTNASELHGKIAVVRHGGVTIASKARLVQNAGAVGLIVIDSNEAVSSAEVNGDDRGDDISIGVVCVKQSDGETLLQTLRYSNCVFSLAIGRQGGAMQFSEGTPPQRKLTDND